jgi:hypothetical protein
VVGVEPPPRPDHGDPDPLRREVRRLEPAEKLADAGRRVLVARDEEEPGGRGQVGEVHDLLDAGCEL